MAKHIRWLEQEEKLIFDALESVPVELIYQQHKRLQSRYGWPERTYIALARKCYRMARAEGVSVVPSLDNWATKPLSRLLKIPPGRIKSWGKEGLKIRKISPRNFAISRDALRAWLSENPGVAADACEDGLAFVLDDDELVEKIKSTPLKVSRPKKVICLETQEVFESSAAAGRALNADSSLVSHAISRSEDGIGKALGLHWQLAQT